MNDKFPQIIIEH